MGNVVPEVEAYIAAVHDAGFRHALEALRELIRRTAPDADEVISYGQPTFVQDGHLVAYAAFKKHLSFFPMSSTAIDQHAEALAGFKTSTGTIQFRPDHPIPDAVVIAIVRERLKQNAEVAAQKRGRKR